MAEKLSGLREYIYSSPFLLNIQKTSDRFLTASYYITGIKEDNIMNFEEEPNKYVSSEFIINKINVEKKFNKALYKSYYLISTSLNTTLLDNTLMGRPEEGDMGLHSLVITESDYQEIMNPSTFEEGESETSKIPHLFPNKEDFYLFLIESFITLNSTYINNEGTNIDRTEELINVRNLFKDNIIPFMNLQNNFLSGSGNEINNNAVEYARIIYGNGKNEIFSKLSANTVTLLSSTDDELDKEFFNVDMKNACLKEFNSFMNTQLFFERYFYGDLITDLYEDRIDFSTNVLYPIYNYIIEWSHDFRETTENGFVFARNLDKSFVSYVPAITFKAVITTSVDGSDSARKIQGFIDLDLVSYNNSDEIFNFQGCIETLESFDANGNLEFSYGIHRIKQPKAEQNIISDTLLASTDNYYSYYNNKNDMEVAKVNNSEEWKFSIALPEDGLHFILGLMLDNELAYNQQMMTTTTLTKELIEPYSYTSESGKTINIDVKSYKRILTIIPDDMGTDADKESSRKERRTNLYNYYTWYRNYSAFDCGFDLANENVISINGIDGRTNYIRTDNNKINYLGTLLMPDSNSDYEMINPCYYCLTNTFQTSKEVRLFRSLNELLHSNVIVKNNYTSHKYAADCVSENDYNKYIEFLDTVAPKKNDSNIQKRESVIKELLKDSYEANELLTEEQYNTYKKAALADQNYLIIESVPVVGSEFYNKSDTNQSYIESVLYNHYSSIKDNLDAIEGNFDVDMKFYNSYGPAKLLQTNKNNKAYNISKTNIALSFSIKVETGTVLDETSFKNEIVDYVNKCNSVREVSFYIYQLISSLQAKYTNIVYMQYNGMTNLVEGQYISEVIDDNTVISSKPISELTIPNYQLITYSSNDITTEQDIIPEYLTIDRKTNENNPTELVPNIIINYL